MTFFSLTESHWRKNTPLYFFPSNVMSAVFFPVFFHVPVISPEMVWFLLSWMLMVFLMSAEKDHSVLLAPVIVANNEAVDCVLIVDSV
ncbi:hypothetical protein N878_27640 [Pseudomonas sp. EGD-AK9]|nr:hypothetical protein N878_27640 [Pseudomonas sp. EGD-AK9]